MTWTDSETDRVASLEENQVLLATTMENLATKRQLNSLIALLNTDITNLRNDLTNLEETGYGFALETHRTDASAHSAINDRFYLRTAFTATSIGSPDAGKPVLTNPEGRIDPSMVSGASAIKIYATEAQNLAEADTDSSITYSQDTDHHFLREKGSWREIEVSDVNDRTLAEMITEAAGATVRVRISRAVDAGSGTTVTVPSTMYLIFEGAGSINIAAGQTLVLQSPITANRSKIFNYADDTSILLFHKTGHVTFLPEWWGAKGDNTTDDAVALRRMFAIPSNLNWTDAQGAEHEYHFASGKHYKTTEQLVLKSVTSGRFASRWIIRGSGSYLIGSNIAGGGTLKLGDVAAGKKCFYSNIIGLNISNTSTDASACALEINRADFGTYIDCNFTSSGGYSVHSTGDGGNGHHFFNCSVGGPVTGTGVSLGQDSLVFNTWSWTGGKIQQCSIGMHIAGAGVAVRNVDLSLHTTSAIKAQNLIEAKLHFYTEGIGPNTPLNTNKVLHMINCSLVSVEDGRINGGVGGSYTNNCGYGVYLETCSDINLDGLGFRNFQRADIYVASDCQESIIIGERNYMDQGGNDLADTSNNGKKTLRVSDRTTRGIRNKLRFYQLPRHRTPTAGTPTNLIPAPEDFTNGFWNLINGTTVSGTTLGPDGLSDAQIVSFPNTPNAGNTSIPSYLQPTTMPFDLGTPLNGKYVVVRFWAKPIAVLASSIYDEARLLCWFYRNSADGYTFIPVPGAFDGYDDWYACENIKFYSGASPDVQTLTLFDFRPSPYAGDAISVAIAHVQVFVTDNPKKLIPWIAAS